ncbi:MAG TPA: metal ABC transporter substrate-binding protein, partial [Gammaproteobacteria bacterium]|nr:metal ABC transporter substrate-binding protein [Gammaproteobacteria bacterium]MCH79123.1 metal ABC transporter substrate-binding protein [Gammaproteobacteria bacterium]
MRRPDRLRRRAAGLLCAALLLGGALPARAVELAIACGALG